MSALLPFFDQPPKFFEFGPREFLCFEQILLARLPQSALVARMTARADAMLAASRVPSANARSFRSARAWRCSYRPSSSSTDSSP
ncbi:MAG: hypothetical protein H0T47_09060 [Planctomycetaceae bacterium]|nr:hypothetical protein [Planctomycetaceae bacterium]